MAHYVDLFSPETSEAFARSPRDVSGFRERHWTTAQRVKSGDLLVCYLTHLSRWIGLLEVLDGPFRDSRPIFLPDPDPFVVRFHVRPAVWLPADKAIPIHDPDMWSTLSFTRELEPGSAGWTGRVRGSLNRLDVEDGTYLARRLFEQSNGGKAYPLDADDLRALTTHRVSRSDKVVTVSVPEDTVLGAPRSVGAPTDVRDSIKIQALVARIGDQMGLRIWIPRADRGAVFKEWKDGESKALDRLPLNYDETTLRTIEQIDVIWLRNRSIVRAFEIEHTTAVYSGLLRMADLLALQPNMDIQLHIVAPEARRDRVFQEIKRPVFALLEKGPLAEICTYLSYERLKDLSAQKHLSHLSDKVLDDYTEDAE